MNELIELFSNPLVWKLLITYWFFSAFVGALPTPDDKSGKFYIFAFRFFHLFAGNLTRAALKFNVPGAEAPKP